MQKFYKILEAVVYISIYSSIQPISSKKVCLSIGVAPRYLENVLQHLVRKKILRALRGAKGGYVLAKEKRKITIDQIYKAYQETCVYEGALVTGSSKWDGAAAYDLLSGELMLKIENSIVKQLKAMTLMDFHEKILETDKNKKKPSDFNI